ncbi:apoptosis-inducing factor 1, mitochondrial [Copidosoma floridanum]|uniref:apoptosis-inducing factor 1, mitochondrial n=1 Tax=Copidosoma floridanum TaxID=29053 RepID=UPI0006C9E18B|nr:apoptosis-inducing factor 1, mitochondrial [Copidosoma floridanum]
MLCHGRLVGQLSRITRHACTSFPDPLKRVGFISTSTLKYSSKSKRGKTGTTLKVDECVPKTKIQKKVPPLPPPPPPPPPIHSTAPPVPPPNELKPPERAVPLCEDRNYNCPPIAQEECYKPGGGSEGKGPEFEYWKHLIATLLLAGVSAYAYFEWFKKDDKEKEHTVIDKGRGRPKLVPDPKEASSIPSEVPYLLIGGGTAAFSAFRSIKSRDPKAKVLIVTNEGDLPYMRPPLSKELWYQSDDLASQLIFRQWNGKKRSLFYEPPEFFLPINELLSSEKGGVAVARGWEIKKIDAFSKTAYLQNNRPIKYEKCLIATGSSPNNLPIFEKADQRIKEKVIVFRTKQDFEELLYNVHSSAVKDIVIVGGGFLGSELSTSLARNMTPEGKRVYQVYKENSVLAQVLPEYLSQWITKHLEAQGVICVPNVEVHDCALKNDKLSLTLSDGQVMEADQVVVAIGVEANVALAKESNLEIHPEKSGFLVNAELEARSDLWVAGDAACFYDVKLGRRRIEHHDHAVISGKLAGENMTGAHKPYLHQSTLWSDLGPEVGFEAIGIIDSNLETVGVFAKDSENDTSKVAVSASNENENINVEDSKSKPKSEPSPSESKLEEKKSEAPKDQPANVVSGDKEAENYEKGVIFYLKENNVVGILLWNIYGGMPVARQLFKRGLVYDEINEAAKLFQIHEEYEE